MTRSVYFFGNGKSDGTREMKAVLGGKGANLAEMTNLGVPVPPGFVIATHLCVDYLESPVIPDTLRADVAVAISGIAGPGGGSPQKPVGTVVFARAIRGQDEEEALAEERLLDGSSRSTVRHQAALVALELLLP